jgi:hypothetical protein
MGRILIASTVLSAAALFIGHVTTEAGAATRAGTSSHVAQACAGQSAATCLSTVDAILASARRECERLNPTNPEECLCEDDDIRRTAQGLADATVIVNETNPALAGRMSRRIIAEAGRCFAATAQVPGEDDPRDNTPDTGSQN